MRLPSLREIRETALAVREAADEERRLLADRRAPARPADALLGAIAVELAFDWSWVDRRELLLEFVEDTTVRRTTRLHFTLPASLSARVAPGAPVVVPLDILRKGGVLLDSEVRDRSGALLTPLNKLTTGRLGGLGLAAFFRTRMGAAFPPQADALMAEIAAGDGPSTDQALAALLAVPAFGQYVASDQQREVEAGLVKHDLKDGFLYSVLLEYRPGVPTVLEYAYDARQDWRAAKTDRLDRTLVALGALPKRWQFPPEPIGRALSSHIEVIAPVDVDIAEARIDGEQLDTGSGTLLPLAGPANNASRSRAQFYIPLRAGTEGARDAKDLSQKRVRGRADRGTITVLLKPRASAALLPVFFSSLMTSVALIFFSFSLSHLDGQTGAAILLVIPALIAAYLVRQGEHPYTTRSLVGVRLLAATGAGCAFVVALMIAVEAFTGQSTQAASVTLHLPISGIHLRHAAQLAVLHVRLVPKLAEGALTVVSVVVSLVLLAAVRADTLVRKRHDGNLPGV